MNLHFNLAVIMPSSRGHRNISDISSIKILFEQANSSSMAWEGGGAPRGSSPPPLESFPSFGSSSILFLSSSYTLIFPLLVFFSFFLLLLLLLLSSFPSSIFLISSSSTVLESSSSLPLFYLCPQISSISFPIPSLPVPLPSSSLTYIPHLSYPIF